MSPTAVHHHHHPSPAAPATTTTAAADLLQNKDLIRLQVKTLFEKHVPSVLVERQSKLVEVDSVYLFEIVPLESKSLYRPTVQPYYWTIDLRKGVSYPGKPSQGQHPVDSTFSLKEDNVIQLLTGKLNPADAFIAHQLKLSGNQAAVFKFHHFWNCPPQSPDQVRTFFEEISRLLSTESLQQSTDHHNKMSTTDQQQPTDDICLETIPIDGLKSDVIFDIIGTRLSEEPELIKKMSIMIQFNITKEGQHKATWTIDTKSKPGSGLVYRSPPQNGRKPDAAITIDDLDYVRLLFGKLNPQKAFMNRKLKITGNVLLLQRLDNLWNQMQKTRRDPELPFVRDLLLDEQPFKSGLRSEIVIFDLLQRLVRLPNLLPASSNLRLVVTVDGKPLISWLIGYNDQAKLSQIKRQSLEGQYIFSPVDLELTVGDLDLVRLCRNPNFKLSQAIQQSLAKLQGDRAAELLPKIESRLFQNPALVSKL